MVKEVGKSESRSYLKQAEEFLELAKTGFERGFYNPAGFNAIQTIINANDAICVHYLERRASTDHREAVRLHTDLIRVLNDASQKRRLAGALEK
ncbi:MAG: HEPN domain-containing protein [Euryarchaeota archaeon]|nr:HEPN domain-containing protein [Euryarchaeota archaeon]